MIFLQQSLEIVCYETVRAASRPQASSAEAIERGNDLIADRNIANCRITLKPKNLQSMSRGAIVTVTATAGSSANAFFPVTFFPKTLKAKAVMVRQ